MRRRDGRVDLLLVCSTGGHLQQLLALRDAWSGYTRVWVTFDKSDARSLLHGARLVYVESFTRIDEPSLTCRLVAPVADRVYAQWPELVRAVPKAHYAGTVFRRQ